MPVSGQELLEQSIDNCQQIASGLGTVNADWETSIVEILEKFDEISDTFFFKTMPSVPAARAVVRESESALALRQSKEWDEFGTAITTLIESSQNLIEKAGMKGVTLT